MKCAAGCHMIHLPNLLESPLAVLALIPDPPVVAGAAPVDAPAREAAAVAGRGRGGRVEREVQRHQQADPQGARGPRVPSPRAPPGRPGPGEVSTPGVIHDGRGER